MFSFIRWVYRRFSILIVLFFHKIADFIRSIISDGRSQRFEECSPFLTNRELIEYTRNPFSWNTLVVPLATRCAPRKYGEQFQCIEKTAESQTEERLESERPKVLVCHDMAGNYRGDRFIHGSTKYDDFRFYHWAGIDYFNYFSHNYITIPPLPWINCAHRNGVSVLGTIIIEFDTAKHLLDEILQSRRDMYCYIEALVLVTKNFGFEGWLVNVECAVNAKQVPMLKEFNRHLTKRIHEEIPGGVVIWYDSVIETGLLIWQNEVNRDNIDMYRGTDGILLNYGWKRENLKRTSDILKGDPKELAKVFVGIDIFGRGQTAGFHTHQTLRSIKEFDFSIGIFAPGWTFERMPDEHPMREEGTDCINKKFLKRNTRFWTLLWKHLYSRGPNTLPFYTSFCLGSGKKQYRNGLQIANEPWFNLMEQQYQPSVPSQFEHQFDEAYHGGSCIKFVNSLHNMRIFATDFACKDNLIAGFVFKRTDPSINVQLVLQFESETGDSKLMIHCDSNRREQPNPERQPFERFVNPLRENLLKYAVVGLSSRHDKIFPSSNRPINGWQTRYFYLHFDDVASCGRIVDVGISINKPCWAEHDSVLLGALHIHSGIDNEERITDVLPILSFDQPDEIRN